jgi:hypothetical protein
VTKMRLPVVAVCFAVCTLALLAAPPALSAQCTCVTQAPTPTLTGAGTDCTAAQNNLISMLEAQEVCAGQGESVCKQTLIITKACHFHQLDNMWKENGYLRYGCLVCF